MTTPLPKNVPPPSAFHVPAMPPRKPRPGFKRVIVDWRFSPNNPTEVPLPEMASRCSYCFAAKFKSKRHMCMAPVSMPAPTAQGVWKPVFQWFSVS